MCDTDQLSFTEVSVQDEPEIYKYLPQMVEEVCAEQNMPSSFIQIIFNEDKKKDKPQKDKPKSKSVWICDPEWMLDFKGKRTQMAFNILEGKKGFEVTLSIGRFQMRDFVPAPTVAEIKNASQGAKKKTTLIFPIDCIEECKEYLKAVFAWELKHFMPAYTFGCCSKYEQCSDERKCLHANPMYSRGCAYRYNLEAGRIFYGKNRNVD